MVIGIFGESCTGKSTIAEKLKELIKVQIYTGKDYLRLEKNEVAAKQAFQKKLSEAIKGENIIYVISEKEHLSLLPEGCIRVLVTADLEIIKARFAQRMHGNLPAPVEAMLEKKHGCFDEEPCDIHIISGQDNIADACEKILNRL
jgi:ABC-type dipeptide/oligopeptide/nickel transport system ATPase component